MVSLSSSGPGARHLRLLKRSSFALLPLLMIGSLTAAPLAAGASTTSAPVTQAASSGGVDLGPTVAALEAEVSTVVANVLNVPLPLVFSVGCVPYYVTAILAGGRIYPC